MIGKLAMARLTGQSWRVLKSWYTGGGLEQRIWELFRRRYLPGFDYVTSATQARFGLQGHYSGHLFTPAELSPLRPKTENYSRP